MDLNEPKSTANESKCYTADGAELKEKCIILSESIEDLQNEFALVRSRNRKPTWPWWGTVITNIIKWLNLCWGDKQKSADIAKLGRVVNF